MLCNFPESKNNNNPLFFRCPNLPEIDIVRLTTARVVVDKLDDETLESRDVMDSFIDDADLDEEEEPHRLLLYQPYMELNPQPNPLLISKSSHKSQKLSSNFVKKQWIRQSLHQHTQQKKTSRHRQPSEPQDDMIYSDEDGGYSVDDMFDLSAEGNFTWGVTLLQGKGHT